MVFLSSGVSEALYSDEAMNTPACSIIIRLSFTAWAGGPDLPSSSPSYSGMGKSCSEIWVTSASARVSSLAASAARRALYDPVRIEPAKTRIFGMVIGGSGKPQLKHFCATLVPAWSGMGSACGENARAPRRGSWLSALAVDPDLRRRQIQPDAFGRMRAHARKRARDRRHDRIGELDEGSG